MSETYSKKIYCRVEEVKNKEPLKELSYNIINDEDGGHLLKGFSSRRTADNICHMINMAYLKGKIRGIEDHTLFMREQLAKSDIIKHNENTFKN